MKHEDAIDLLSWYAAGTLQAAEAAAVAAHVEDCSDCSAELAELEMLHVAVAVDGPEEPAFRPALIQEALTRIENEEAANRSPQSRPNQSTGLLAALQQLAERLSWSATPAFARYAMVGQLALVVGLAAVLLLSAPADPDYVTLSGGGVVPVGQTHYGLVFAPGTSEAEARQLLVELDAQIVAGPTALGLYTIAFGTDTDPGPASQRLRASDKVSYLQLVPAS